MTRDELQPYLILMGLFYSKKTDAGAFEKEYLMLFKGDQRKFPEEICAILNDLFVDVDAFVADQSIREKDDLNADQLWESSRKAYFALDGLLPKD